MDTPEYPSNSKSMPPSADQKKVKQVVVGEVRSRPKSLGKRLKEALFGGDSKSALQYVLGDVVVPHAKDLISEAATQMIEQIIFGGSRGGYRRPPGRTNGYTNYTRYSARDRRPSSSIREERPTVTLRSSHDLDELVFDTRQDAQNVLDQMDDFLETYEQVSVADLYTMLGWTSRSTHTDQKWGWESLKGADIKLIHGGYLLILPKTIALG